MDLASLEGRRRRARVAGRLRRALGGGRVVVGELDAAVFVGAVVDAELRGQGLDALGALAHLPRAVVDRACGLASLTVAFVAGRIRVLAAVGLGGNLGSVVDLAHGHGLPDSESRGLVPRNRSGRPNRLGGRRVGTIVTVDLAGHVRAIDGGDTQIRGCEVTQRRVARDRRQVRGRPAQRRRRSSGGRYVPRDPALGRGVQRRSGRGWRPGRRRVAREEPNVVRARLAALSALGVALDFENGRGDPRVRGLQPNLADPSRPELVWVSFARKVEYACENARPTTLLQRGCS